MCVINKGPQIILKSNTYKNKDHLKNEGKVFEYVLIVFIREMTFWLIRNQVNTQPLACLYLMIQLLSLAMSLTI